MIRELIKSVVSSSNLSRFLRQDVAVNTIVDPSDYELVFGGCVADILIAIKLIPQIKLPLNLSPHCFFTKNFW